jgi:hypothetical protein
VLEEVHQNDREGEGKGEEYGNPRVRADRIGALETRGSQNV